MYAAGDSAGNKKRKPPPSPPYSTSSIRECIGTQEQETQRTGGQLLREIQRKLRQLVHVKVEVVHTRKAGERVERHSKAPRVEALGELERRVQPLRYEDMYKHHFGEPTYDHDFLVLLNSKLDFFEYFSWRVPDFRIFELLTFPSGSTLSKLKGRCAKEKILGRGYYLRQLL